jgi:CDP-6-deoxy-D-xylo-4-hexulose-3-dehydrase
MVMTDDAKLAAKIITLRDWGRAGSDLEAFEKRFNFKIDGIPHDSKFVYTEFGYNLKINEVSAAFGLVQLKRLPKFIKKREWIFKELLNFFSKYEKWFYLPYLVDGAKTVWYSFPLCVKEDSPFSRYELLKHLEAEGIQTRVFFSGNIAKHPVFKNSNLAWKSVGSLKNANLVMANGFLLGCHQGMSSKDVKYVTSCAQKFLKKYE